MLAANSRLVDLVDFTERSLRNDVGIVADEDSEQSLYVRIGCDSAGERALSPEIGNWTVNLVDVCSTEGIIRRIYI